MDQPLTASHSEMIGHSVVLDVLRKQWSSEPREMKVLLSGESHIGKQTIAMRFLKSLHCKQSELFEPCERCHDCRMIDRKSHADHQELDGSLGKIRIQQIQELMHWMSRASEDFRTIVVNDVHEMTRSACNAFLKILEEPPARSIMVFVTPYPLRVLPTFRSRVQWLRMYRVPYRELRRALPDVPHPTLRRIAGRPGLLASMGESKLSIPWRQLLAGNYHEKRGVLTGIFGKRKNFSERSLLARNLLRTSIQHLRSVVLAHLNVSGAVDSQLETEDLQAIMSRRDLQNCRDQIRATQGILQTLSLNIHPELACEYVFLSNRPQQA